MKINLHCKSFWYFIKKNLTFDWIRIYNGGKYHSEINVFLKYTLATMCIMPPFYSITLETSICQFNSSTCSPIMPDEVREHQTRDQRPFLHPESLQTLYIPSSRTVLLLFSSLHSCSTGFRSENWDGHSRSLVLCSVTHFVFEVCVWIIVHLEDPNMAHL